MSKRAILIAGPTASGKSQTALDLARALNGVIINTDSMQVYEGLPILTALPSRAELQEVPHKLYGFREAPKSFSVADWLTEAEKAANSSWGETKLPIFVGGTGLYFKGLVDGIAPIPEVPGYIKLNLEKKLETEGLPTLFKELQNVDPTLGKRLEPNDKQRIIRALSVFIATGKPLSYWQGLEQDPILKDATLLKVVLTCPPEKLNPIILNRLKKMVEQGVLDEIKAFSDRHLASHLPIMKVLGLAPFQAYLKGEATLNGALDKGMIETRQYAKRQRTWFRNQFPDWERVEAGPKAFTKILSLAKQTFGD